MKNSSVVSIACVLCLAAAGLSGCRTRDAAAVDATAGSPAAAEEVFHALQTRPPEYGTFSARLHVEFTSGTETSFSSRASLTVLRDRRLQLSIQPFAGIEAMRIELSPDSIRALDRMNRRYLAEALENVRGNMHALSFHNLQALLTNRIFVPGETSLPERAFGRFRYEPATQGYVFRTQDADGLSYRFTSRGENLSAVEIADSRYVLHLDYASFSPVAGQPFPMEIRAEWRDGDGTKASLAVRYSRIDLDLPVDMRFDVPKSYEPVDVSQILKPAGQI
ncbi:MAG: DUF4292 domain-containing protein [Tannerella sp.]|jgi:hypothetical protein|nr:DUF4292 domain-containing protein [Tannerella sp.]